MHFYPQQLSGAKGHDMEILIAFVAAYKFGIE
jgi:hypothetical protein